MNILSSGSQTATINTKHQLYTLAVGGAFALVVDTHNMVLGDAIELFVEAGCASGDAHQQAYYVTYAHSQADPAKISVPVLAPYGATFHLKQTSGTGRVFKWCVVEV